jgi:hypothetical protein
MTSEDEFYIGYDAGMGPRTRKTVAAAVVVGMVAAIATAALIVAGQRPLADSRFAYGAMQEVSGFLLREPAPALMRWENDQWRRYWLVSRGKFGPEHAVGRDLAGWVRLAATRVDREPWHMLEVADGSARSVPAESADPPSTPSTSSRHVTLRGEVVDSKCYLGVMNPGEGVVHRDCAVRCLAGGVTPMFAFRDDDGAELAVLRGGPATARLAGHAATLTGTLSRAGDALVFTVDPQ